MADPICRWRNPNNIQNVVELIGLLPKEELPKDIAREIVENAFPGFFRTPYQLACQLGLYHERNERYFPKFTFIPSEEEVRKYLTNWIVRYCVPNPYTRGFDDLQPFSIHAELCRRLVDRQDSLNWEETRRDIFRSEIGNIDILTNSINTYSPVISIDNNFVALKEGRNYEDLISFCNVDVSVDRDNKEYFFDLFPITDNPANNEGQVLIDQANEQDTNLIRAIRNAADLTQTEKNQLIAARIGQGYFRRNLILSCGFCPVTLVDDSRFLIASHIKPWKASSNAERLNTINGFMFTPTIDKLFDRGYISFTNEKRIIISPSIPEVIYQRFNLAQNTLYPQLPSEGREVFLEYHRANIFKP